MWERGREGEVGLFRSWCRDLSLSLGLSLASLRSGSAAVRKLSCRWNVRSIGYYGFFRFAFSLSDRVSNNVRHTVALKLVEFDFWSARTRHCGDADLRWMYWMEYGLFPNVAIIILQHFA
ncbi:uncharacterized protein [Physcomitrium patens]|uniref:uncharacterized protein n=1 Tax=Physcomitrium patens TaxID=3218 RepID=UPI003CCD8E0E